MFDSQTYLHCECCGEFVNESEAMAHENSCSPQGIREDRAYTHVEESSNNCSFLCNEDSLDIATLHRVRPDEVSATDHKAACLSDKGWQATVNLVAAAPELLAALKCALADLEGSLQAHNQTDWYAHDWEAHQQSIDEARAAIAKATK